MKKFLGLMASLSFGLLVLSFGGSSGCGGGTVSKCGDGVISGIEVCDGGALNGQTCESQGFSTEGTLKCAADCKSFDTSGCVASGTLSGLTAISGDKDEFISAHTDALGNFYAQVNSTSASMTVGDKTISNTTALANVYRSSLAKVSPDGTVVWLEGFQGNSTDPGSGDDLSMFFDPSGDAFVDGIFRGSQLSAPGRTLPNTDATGMTYDTYAGRLNNDGTLDWFATFNSGGGDQVFAQFDPSGNLYVTGHFQGSTVDANGKPLTNGGGGSSDVFIEKVDPATGAAVWIASFSSDANDDVFPHFDASGNLFVNGDFSGTKLKVNGADELTNASAGSPDAFVGRLDPATGDLLWITGFSSTGFDFIDPLAIDPAGNVYAAGIFSGPTLTAKTKTVTSAGSGDGFISKLDPSDGSVAWLTGISSGGSDSAMVVTDSRGNVYVSGSFLGATLNAGGKSLTNADASGTTADNFLGRVNVSDGTFDWLNGIQGPGFSGGVMGSFEAFTDASHVYVAAAFSGATLSVGGQTLTNADASGSTEDAFAAQFNSDGTLGWLVDFSGSGNEFVTFQPDFTSGTFPADRIYLQGTFSSATLSVGGETLTNADASGTTNDAFVARLNPADGTFVWLIPFSSDGDDFGSLVPDAFGHLALAVAYKGKTVVIGGETFTNVDTSGTTRDGVAGLIAP